MCYICNCFSWTLDLIQRILTFFLTCWLTIAICSGFVIATVAGMAYGYNYSIVEFLTLNKTDNDNVGVHMRRGVFYDDADVLYTEKTKGVSDNDNLFENYEQEMSSSESSVVPNELQKSDEPEKYREKLIRYYVTGSEADFKQVEFPQRTYKGLMTPHYIITSKSSTLRFSTFMKPKPTSNIMMKMFEPIRTKTKLKFVFGATKSKESKNKEDKKYAEKVLDKIITANSFKKNVYTPDIRIRFDDFTKSTRIKMRHFWPTTPSSIKLMSTKQILFKSI